MAQLYLVPTPIGNLEDMTHRAVRLLNEADLILAEDTRTSKKLLQHYQISTPMQSYHMHNEHHTTQGLVKRIASGEVMALITDAGTPGISDPGFFLARACIQEGISVTCLPGATAFVPALVQSGLPNDRFVFEGFLPPKKGRQTRLAQIAQETRSTILYESPYKLVKTLNQLIEVCGADRPCAVARELTKLFEETQRGTLKEVADHYTDHPPKGELVIVLGGAIQETRKNHNHE